MGIVFRQFIMDDYDGAIALWTEAEGIGLSEADSRENIARYLSHNPGMSFVAALNGRIVGAVLCGTDGRRGFLHHLAVSPAHRKSGLGKALVDHCLASLAAAGMRKCHIFVISDNVEGQRFWKRTGWEERTTLKVMSHDVGP